MNMKTLLALLLLIPNLSWGVTELYENYDYDEFCINLKNRIDTEVELLNFFFNELNDLSSVDDDSLKYLQDSLFKRSTIYKNICD